jgi:hypothetical protein
MPTHDRRLITGKLFESVLDQIRAPEAVTLHQWNAEKMIKHFAFLLPEDKRFSIVDIEVLLHKSNIGTASFDEKEVVYKLARDNILAHEGVFIAGVPIVRPSKYVAAYFMPKPIRVVYERQIEKAHSDQEPERRSVSERLRGLRSRLTDPAQHTFPEETLDCLTMGANRAAIVMGWNLAFDHLTQWIFHHQLDAYNKELTCQFKDRRKRIYCDPVVDYRDFSLTTERTVLDVCEKANLFEKNESNVLHEGLNKRNRYAHPSRDTTATPAIAAGHIEELLLHVVLNDKFAP